MMKLAELMGLRSGGNRTLGRYLPSLSIGRPPISNVFIEDVLRLFDSGEPRQMRYTRYWNYYTNDQYTRESVADRTREKTAAGGKDYSAQLESLYAFTRSFYNPVTQTVDMDVDTVFREPTRFSANKAGKNDALDLILRRSRMDERRLNLVRFGAATGDVYLRVDADPDTKAIKIFVHSPELVRVVRSPHDHDIIEYAVISYDYNDYSGNEIVEHNRTDVIYPDVIRTFRDGVIFDFDGRPGERDNPLGVVPIFPVANLDVDLGFGLPTYHNVIPTLDVVNEIFSFLMNIIKMNADPTVIAEGIRAGDLTKGNAANPHATQVWYVPLAPAGTGTSGPKIYMLEWKGNLPDVMGMLRDVRTDIVDALPEMHITKMQQQGAYSGFALNAMMFGFVSKATRMRIIYKNALQRAMGLSLAADAILNGEISWQDYDPLDPEWETTVSLPPVLPVDENALINQVVTKLEAGLIGAEDALKELGYPQDEWKALLNRAKDYAENHLGQQPAIIPNAQGAKTTAISKAAERAAAGSNGQPINKQMAANGTGQ